MQQQIGFCTTTDGGRIAYATVGTGQALVVSNHALYGPGVTGTPASCYAAMGYGSPPMIYQTAPRHCTSFTSADGMVTTNCN
jgi:hypothetical protein